MDVFWRNDHLLMSVGSIINSVTGQLFIRIGSVVVLLITGARRCGVSNLYCLVDIAACNNFYISFKTIQ